MSGKKSLKPRAVSQHGLRVASRQLAQYCETGGAVDSTLEVFFYYYYCKLFISV